MTRASWFAKGGICVRVCLGRRGGKYDSFVACRRLCACAVHYYSTTLRSDDAVYVSIQERLRKETKIFRLSKGEGFVVSRSFRTYNGMAGQLYTPVV